MALKIKNTGQVTSIHIFSFLIIFIFLQCNLFAQLYEYDTKDMRLIYTGEASKYLVNYVGQCFENALKFNSKLYNYHSDEKTTVLVYDLNDFGNAGTGTIPRNHIVLSIAPLSYEYETSPANERFNTTFNHELVHLVTLDQSTSADRFYRTIFGGKVYETSDDPITILYAFLTDPRRSTPRWWKEGIAVFLETWMAGGIGRAQGGYDEMVFRTMVQEKKPIYDIQSLESEGTQTDFQVGANSYLYGTRFMSYLALKYSPEKLIKWTSRYEGSSAYFASSFEDIYNLPLSNAWEDWIKFENEFQEKNLAKICQYPVTAYRPIVTKPLGALSRAYFDESNHKIYCAIDFPGQVAQIVSIDTKTGVIEKIHDVKRQALYYVTSLAYDPEASTLFYTTDNNDWRSIYSIDIKSGDETLLLKEQRIGDLVFNLADKSLWGIRHYNGQSTIVRIPYPYTEWNQIYSWPFGQDMYNIDISHDGKILTGALAEINGQQLLIKMNVDSLMAGDFSYDTLVDFENTIPANFIFSDDGKYLYGTSYFTGVSNIWRYDFDKNDVEIMSNAETGFFRPMPISNDSVLTFNYTTDGFQPIMIANEPVPNVKAIDLLGRQIIEKHPIVEEWIAPPPSSINIDSLIISREDYSIFNDFGLNSVYPIIRGYKDYLSYGLHFNFSDPIGFQNVELAALYSPYNQLEMNERLHLDFTYSYLNWQFKSTLNKTDFYDLFGPTKTSRKGYSLGLKYHKYITYDKPLFMDYTIYTNYYGNLERLPDYQNIAVSFDRLFNIGAKFGYEHQSASLGAVDKEKGFNWKISFDNNFVRKTIYPQLHTDFDLGFPLPINHSSIWLRSSVGYAYGERFDPFTNFYFGGFGNNYVDHQDEKRYREYYSFPGVELNNIAGTNYAKLLLEWNLPPLRFSNIGFTSFFLNYARTSLFSGVIITNIDSKEYQSSLANLGAQVDFRMIMLFNLKMTFSVGYALAFEKNQKLTDELMLSLKIL
jgi:hypothetical protein